MKCMIISPQCIIPPYDGGKLCTYSQVRRLEEYIDSVYLVMGNCEDEEDCSQWFDKNTKVYKLKRTSSKLKGGIVKRLSVLVNWLLSGLPRQAQTLEGYHKKQDIMSLIRREEINCVVLITPYASEYVDLYKLKQSNVKVILIEQNVEYVFVKDILCKYGILSRLEIMRTFKYEMNVIKDASSVYALSPKDADILNNTLNVDKVKYLPTLSMNKRERWTGMESDYIVFSGSLSFSPNYEGMKWFMENVWKIYARNNHKLRLKITGKVDEKIKKEFSIYPNIEFTGYLNDEDLQKTFLGCLFAVIPIFKGSGIKIKLLEALSYGVPVLATLHCFDGVPYEKKCYKIPPYFLGVDGEDFLKKIEMLYKDEKTRIMMSQSAIEFYKSNYSGKDNIKRWLKCIC